MYSEVLPTPILVNTPLKGNNFQGRIVADSRLIKPGDVFIAYRGEYLDGRQFIAQAVAKGAVSVIYEQSPDFEPLDYGVPLIAVDHLREKVGIIVASWLGIDLDTTPVIGVTGTNGKTSITQWLAQAFSFLNKKCAIMGTTGNGFVGKLSQSTHTTLDPVSLQNKVFSLIKEGAEYIAMEVSSHGLYQFRVNGTVFHTAIFTNLTRDHLDYHNSMENYGDVKRRLFYWKNLKHAVINIDDEFGRKLAKELSEKPTQAKLTTYGFSQDAMVRIIDYRSHRMGFELSVETPWGNAKVKTNLIGRFNALNLLASLSALCGMGFDLSSVVEAMAIIKPAIGRMDCINMVDKPLIVIDYAHTPDALKNTLLALRDIKKEGKIWCVFGCGGGRDKGKRLEMGKMVNDYSDYAVITSDNPRNDDPQSIIDDILPSIQNACFVNILRREAIYYAIKEAHENDIVLIAGKGHEDYQEIKGVKYSFDDFQEAKIALEQYER